jgi:ATP-dependent helicase/nuclease subunit A
VRALDASTPADEFMELRELAGLLGKQRGSALTAWLQLDGDKLRGTLATAWGAAATAEEARATAELVADVERAVAARKRADGVLTFDDLVRGAASVMETHPAVARRYGSRFRAVLVDEFQDTDGLQARLIAQLTAGGDTSLFVVGDEKQSIYRFRGADVTVFAQTSARLGTPYPLGLNFRSQPEVLGFVNALAAEIFQPPAGRRGDPQWLTFEPGQRLSANREQTRRDSVRLVTFAGLPEVATVGTAREIEARVLAEVLVDLHERPLDPVGWGDVAVLFRTLNQVKAYEYALARRGVPYYVVKGRGFFQCQEVRDLANLLAAIALPGDDLALAAVLRSPLFGLDDDTLWRLAWPAGAGWPDLGGRLRTGEGLGDLGAAAPLAARAREVMLGLRSLHGRSHVAETLVRALAATDLEAVYLTQFQGRQKVANVRKVVELARDFDRRGQGGAAEFARWLRRLDAEEPREPEAVLEGEGDQVVRLMTIHQAKGLEFPVVVLVDLLRKADSDTHTVVVDREDGILLPPLLGPGGQPLRHAGLDAHRERERGSSDAEAARLLYVACTRAADELVLLEGRACRKDLAKEPGTSSVWCHRIWDTVGRDAVGAAAGGTEPVRVTLAEGTSVSIEPAGRFLRSSDAATLAPPEPREATATPEAVAAVERVLGFRAPRPREVATTPTALAAFERCPRQYWFRHVIGLAEGGIGGRRARLMGTLAHGVLERVDYAAEPTEASLAALVAGRPESLQLPPRRIDEVLRDLALATALVRREVAGGLAIVAREEAVTLGLPAERPEVVLSGRIDVLARRQGALVVQDYKYAEASEARTAEYAAQLAPYRTAVARLTGEPVAGEIVFVRGTPRLVALPPLDAARTEAGLLEAGRALGLVVGERDPAAFPRRPTDPAACRALGCGFVRRCFGRGAGLLTDSAPDAPSRTAGA